MNKKLKNIIHKCDLCVVGGGLAGMCAAISAARHGIKVVIMQDRPLFGGNASGEIRMWVCGAHGPNNRETGIIEEIALENLYRNPYRNYPIWDSILFEFVKREENITVLLNCSCNDCEMYGNEIKSIVGWQTTTQLYHTVEAKMFTDCSGDSILAPLSGAEYTLGREGRAEYNESIAPEIADKKTMGLSCLIQARQTTDKHTYIPPEWAYKYTKEDLPYRLPDINDCNENFWYMELGGTQNTIEDAEEIRDELLKVAYGIWDFVKNSGECDADNWELEFVGFLPGKRESRRYIGDYIMTQNDVRSGGKFEDTVAYGGWTMDDHNPDGIKTKEPPNIFHDAPSPFGIPYRSLYSKNIDNLYFAGRNISVTHCAMSATRVMATCALLGQAVGTAAAIAVKNDMSPRDVYKFKINELKQTLMEDDCYLPGNAMEMSEIMKKAIIKANGKNAEALRNGYDRPIGENSNCWSGTVNEEIEIIFDKLEFVNEIRITFDSDLNRDTIGAGAFEKEKSCICNIPLDLKPVHLPETLVKDMKIEILDENGNCCEVKKLINNRRRKVASEIKRYCRGIKLTPLSTYGSKEVNIFSVNIK